MAISKINFGENTLIDLTKDTVTPDTLISGVTAHSSKGEIITGVAPFIVELSQSDYDELVNNNQIRDDIYYFIIEE